jgi:hypothetical protein
MAVLTNVITQGQVPNTADTLYSSSDVSTIRLVLFNTSSSPVVVSLFMNGTATSNQMATIRLVANGQAHLIGLKMGDGDVLYGVAGTDDVVNYFVTGDRLVA